MVEDHQCEEEGDEKQYCGSDVTASTSAALRDAEDLDQQFDGGGER